MLCICGQFPILTHIPQGQSMNSNQTHYPFSLGALTLINLGLFKILRLCTIASMQLNVPYAVYLNYFTSVTFRRSSGRVCWLALSLKKGGRSSFGHCLYRWKNDHLGTGAAEVGDGHLLVMECPQDSTGILFG